MCLHGTAAIWSGLPWHTLVRNPQSSPVHTYFPPTRRTCMCTRVCACAHTHTGENEPFLEFLPLFTSNPSNANYAFWSLTLSAILIMWYFLILWTSIPKGWVGIGIGNGFGGLDVCDSHYFLGKTTNFTESSDYTFVSLIQNFCEMLNGIWARPACCTRFLIIQNNNSSIFTC